MKKTRFTDEQIIGFLWQAEAGMPIKDICRAGGFSQPTFYKWSSRFSGMEASDAAKLRDLESEDANLAVRRRKKVKRTPAERVPLQLAQGLNEVWSMDFVSDSLANGRRIKCLTVADDFSHKCLDIAVDYGISGEYVTRILDRWRCSGAIPWRYELTTVPSSPAANSWPGHTHTVYATS